ncbi:MAG: PAS domain S-box protein [Candidatus Helarchaeota archaeon]
MVSNIIKILLISNNLDDVRSLTEALRKRADDWCKIEYVDHLVAALKNIEKENYALILLDLEIPEYKGLETFKELYEKSVDIPIIVLSEKKDAKLAMETVQNGAQDFLEKGTYDSNMIVRSIKLALKRHMFRSNLNQKLEKISMQRAFIQTILDNNLDGIIIIGQDGVVEFVNPAATRILNEEASRMVGKIFKFPFFKGNVGELEIFVEQGKKRKVEMRTTKILWDDEEAYLAIIRDITEQKEMEQALKASEERAKAQYKGIPISTTTWQKQKKHYLLIDYNDAAFELTNGKISEKLGKKAMKFYQSIPEIRKYMDKCFKEKETIKKLIEIPSKSTTQMKSFEFNFAYVPPDLVMVHSEEITGRVEAERALKNEKEFIEAILETANSLIVGLNKDGNIVFFNKKCEEVTGWNRTDVLGKNWFEVFIPDDIYEDISQIFKQTSLEHPTTNVNPINTKQGRRLIWWHNTAIKRESERIVVAIGIDITEEEKYRKRIEELNKWLRLIIHILGHDILNDFHAIKLALDLLKREVDNKALTIALNNVNSSVKLIKKMRELESLITHENELQIIDARATIQEVVKPYSSQSIQINLEGNCLILADGGFNSVIDNLIQNAIIHGQTDRIDIKLLYRGKYCEIRIADYGRGIPAEIKPRIFEEGFKYGETGQSGLGLYIVKSILERYDGTIHVEDNEPTGTVFVIRLKAMDKLSK